MAVAASHDIGVDFVRRDLGFLHEEARPLAPRTCIYGNTMRVLFYGMPESRFPRSTLLEQHHVGA